MTVNEKLGAYQKSGCDVCGGDVPHIKTQACPGHLIAYAKEQGVHNQHHRHVAII